jgi:hypothetical protein
MKHQQERGLRKIGREIGKEATRQLRGFPDEFRRQITRGWGKEFARQIFGSSPRPRRSR